MSKLRRRAECQQRLRLPLITKTRKVARCRIQPPLAVNRSHGSRTRRECKRRGATTSAVAAPSHPDKKGGCRHQHQEDPHFVGSHAARTKPEINHAFSTCIHAFTPGLRAEEPVDIFICSILIWGVLLLLSFSRHSWHSAGGCRNLPILRVHIAKRLRRPRPPPPSCVSFCTRRGQ